MNRTSSVVLVLAAIAPLACSRSGGGAVLSESVGDGPGAIQVAFTREPAEVTCVRLRVTGSGNKVDVRLDTRPRETATFTLEGLLTGGVNVEASGYPIACADVTPAYNGGLAPWCALAAPTLVSAQVISVSINLGVCGVDELGVTGTLGDGGGVAQLDAAASDGADGGGSD